MQEGVAEQPLVNILSQVHIKSFFVIVTFLFNIFFKYSNQ